MSDVVGELVYENWGLMTDHMKRAAFDRLRAENAELRKLVDLHINTKIVAERVATKFIGRVQKERDELRAQIAAHEKVCAGVWVKVGERDPKKGLHWTTCVVDWDGSSAQCETWFDGLSWLTSNDARVTHWLDARPPGEE